MSCVMSVCVQETLCSSLFWHTVSLWLYEAAGLPVYQRSSVRWSVWWKSLQNRESSQLAALRSSTCGGSTCCTLCGPAWANSPVFTYIVDFTYDSAKILKQAVFVLYISKWRPVHQAGAKVCSNSGASHLERQNPCLWALWMTRNLLFSGEGSGRWR